MLKLKHGLRRKGATHGNDAQSRQVTCLSWGFASIPFMSASEKTRKIMVRTLPMTPMLVTNTAIEALSDASNILTMALFPNAQ
jgi:hypothetical protein